MPKVVLVEQASAAEGRFHALDAGIGQLHIAREFVERVVHVRAKPATTASTRYANAESSAHSARDDQRDARLVDQDGIGLVDDGKCKRPLDQFVRAPRQTVAQVVEADFVRSRVGHIAQVRGAALLRGHVLRDMTRRKVRTNRRSRPSTPRRGGPDSRWRSGRVCRGPDARTRSRRAPLPASCPRRSASPRYARVAARARPGSARRTSATRARARQSPPPARTSR